MRIAVAVFVLLLLGFSLGMFAPSVPRAFWIWLGGACMGVVVGIVVGLALAVPRW